MEKPGLHRSMALLVASLALTTLLVSAGVGTVFSSGTLRPASQSLSAQDTPEPGMMFKPSDRLDPPPMSDPPTQVEHGHYAYWLSCMACHGDRGQGLTDEWRGVLDPADQNCWQSKCHASNHPPEGFKLPETVPAIIAPGRLSHHGTAAKLYQYLRTRMPWQAPGILTDEEYWQLTAFLVEATGVSLGGMDLGPENASSVRLTIQTETSAMPGRLSIHWLAPAAVVTLVLLSGTIAWQRRPGVR